MGTAGWRVLACLLALSVGCLDVSFGTPTKGTVHMTEREYCGSGWRRFKDGCYKLFQVPRKSFVEADKACVSMNASIAEINSKEEAAYLLNTFGGPDLLRSPWIKLTVRSTFGKMKTEALATRLVHVNQRKLGVFENTTEEAPYICERQSLKVCWEGWKEKGEHCFQYFGTRNYFGAAEKICQKHNAHLASIHSKEEFDHLMKHVRKTHRYYGVWIGLKYNNRKATWTDKSKTSYKPSLVRRCSRVKRSLYYGKLVRQYKTERRRKPFVGVCLVKDGKEPFFCERAKAVGKGSVLPKPVVCRDPWMKSGDHCYKFISSYKSFEEAEKYCHRYKAHLPSLNSQQEFYFLKSYYQKKYPMRKRILNIFKHSFTVVGPWIGAEFHEGVLTWTDGSKRSYRLPFFNARGIPHGHHAIIAAKKPSKFFIVPSKRGKKYPFFCELDPRTPFVAYPNKPKEKKCKAGWTTFNRYCYKYFKRPLSFARAEMECTSNAGHLSSVTSKDEYAFLSKMIPNRNHVMNAWIGMKTMKDSDGAHWSWTDGRSNKYNLRHSIDGLPKGADVARLLKYRGKPQGAFDTTKNHKYPFICKKRIGALCEGQWEHFDGNCYRFFHTRLAFLDAEADCQRYNSHLTSINSDAEFDFLQHKYRHKDHIGKRFLNMLGNSLSIVGPWVGFIIRDRSKALYSWTDGSPALYTPEIYKFKLKTKRNKQFVTMLAEIVGHFRLVPNGMNVKMPYLCKKKVGERRKEDIGSRSITKLRRLLQRIAAGKHFHKRTTNEVRPTAKPTTGATTSRRTTVEVTLSRPKELGGERIVTSTPDIRKDLSTAKPTTIATMTTPNRPTSTTTPVVTTPKSTTTMTKATTSTQSTIVATTLKGTTSTTYIPDTTAAKPTLSAQPKDWKKFNDHYYGVIRQKKSFIDAEKWCLDHGSHLSSIHSKEEYEFVVKQIPRITRLTQAWVGMKVQRKRSGEVVFKWTDGTKNDYKPWPMKLDGKPAGADAARLVVTRTKSLGFHDTTGETKFYFVCKTASK